MSVCVSVHCDWVWAVWEAEVWCEAGAVCGRVCGGGESGQAKKEELHWDFLVAASYEGGDSACGEERGVSQRPLGNTGCTVKRLHVSSLNFQNTILKVI